MRIRTVPGRKLLIASIGVAAVSYVACATPAPPTPETTGNLMPPQTMDAAPPLTPTATASELLPPTSGNLVAPPPVTTPPAPAPKSK